MPQSKFTNVGLQNITHIRTAHYAVFRVTNHLGDFVARIGLVDQDALKNALNCNLIAGAGIDTASEDWAEVKNTVLTPHNGYNTRESDENLGRIITENIQAYAEGKPINRIA